MLIRQCAALASALALGFAVLAAPVKAADADDVIDYRQNVMKAIGAHTAALGLIVQGKVDQKDAFVAHANGLAEASSVALAAFRENTHGKGKKRTTAREDVWTKWAPFETGFNTLSTASAEMAKLAAAGDMAGATAKFQDATKTCKACHSDYRSR